LPSLYPATIGRTYRYRDTELWEELKKYAIEIGSGARIYTPVFIQIGLGVQKLSTIIKIR
jgi:hypothetical protein